MSRFSVFAAFIFLAALAGAQMPLTAALKALAKVEFCAVGPVGYAARTSQGELNARTLLAQPKDQAVAAFIRLYGEGNPQARCYALAALHQLDESVFVNLVKSMPARVTVEIMQGCVGQTKSLAEVATMISKDEFHISTPGSR